tara:strand:+ start:4050 stop:4670 length:621 start_codon:yes stop_codon:yes gene_type:complete
MKNLQTIIISIIFGVIAAVITTTLISNPTSIEKTQGDLIKEFYDIETAVSVSPHHIRKGMAKGDDSFILIDLRSNEEYVEEHIIGAINIPAYKDRDHSDYGAIKRITDTAKQIKADNPEKDIIVYCYSIPCMTGRKVGKILADEGVYVKHLGVGWNEWRYYWQLWNHPHEWETTNVEDYVTSGPEPGVFDADITGTGCPIEGGLGC